jgi:hypothetical protein
MSFSLTNTPTLPQIEFLLWLIGDIALALQRACGKQEVEAGGQVQVFRVGWLWSPNKS